MAFGCDCAQLTKSGAQREINMHAANVKWMFVMNENASSSASASAGDQHDLPAEIVVQVDSHYGYRLITLRSPVQVRSRFICYLFVQWLSLIHI